MEMEKVDDNKEKEEEIGRMKKQVSRRRQQKAYKERLMNMAEARKEIATALKFHRASINQQQQQQPTTSTSTTSSNKNHNYLPSCPSPIPNHYYPIPPISPPPLPLHYEHLNNLALPNQTLGLNLNFQNFNNLNTTIYHTPPMAVASKESDHENDGGQEKAIKVSGCDHDGDDDDDDGYDHPFEQVMEFPPWLINANESSCLQDHHFCDEYLPWMDIGEIEGMDGEWLA